MVHIPLISKYSFSLNEPQLKFTPPRQIISNWGWEDVFCFARLQLFTTHYFSPFPPAFYFRSNIFLHFFAQLDCNASSILCWWCLTTARAGLQGEVVPRALREISLVSVNYKCARFFFSKKMHVKTLYWALNLTMILWSVSKRPIYLLIYLLIYVLIYFIRFSHFAEHLTSEWIVHYFSKLWTTNIKILFATKVKTKSGILLIFCPASANCTGLQNIIHTFGYCCFG